MGAIGSFFTYIRNGLRLGVNGNNEFPVSQELVLALLLKYLAKEDVDTRKVVKFFIRSSEGHIHEVPKKELEEGKHFPGLLKEATSTD